MSEELNPINGEATVEACEICNGVECDCECTTNPCACCVAADNSKWGEIGHDIPGKFYQVYYGGKVLFDDESLYNAFPANSEIKSSISVNPAMENYKANKYGLAEKFSEIAVTITVNEELKSKNPLAPVVIDGKYYDLNRLNSVVNFVMDKDHKISIIWSEELVETFRIITKK